MTNIIILLKVIFNIITFPIRVIISISLFVMIMIINVLVIIATAFEPDKFLEKSKLLDFLFIMAIDSLMGIRL